MTEFYQAQSAFDLTQGLLGWVVVLAVWIFIIWVLWAALSAVRGIRKDIGRMADHLEVLTESLETGQSQRVTYGPPADNNR
jgi:uncharacterized membrane protein